MLFCLFFQGFPVLFFLFLRLFWFIVFCVFFFLFCYIFVSYVALVLLFLTDNCFCWFVILASQKVQLRTVLNCTFWFFYFLKRRALLLLFNISSYFVRLSLLLVSHFLYWLLFLLFSLVFLYCEVISV